MAQTNIRFISGSVDTYDGDDAEDIHNSVCDAISHDAPSVTFQTRRGEVTVHVRNVEKVEFLKMWPPGDR